ncbi:type II CAAX endopeptidase family protein [Tissierella sp.]|uniref:type II CAAX endopeptidase family protein n=1 Tax=Tissierella sp. TaxID=41274 RepID=UPI002854EA21|nr:type II CAAX endopeptidase family protein [Tissierella sp.]MDR7857901.1 type II CAAX endopeptidase family protein [Tissierella sp.]
MKDKKAIRLFLIITFVLSGICYYIRIIGGDDAAGMTAILMWCPAISAFIIQRIYYRKEKLLGWNPCKITYLLIGLFVPVIYIGLSYGLYWIVNRDVMTGQIQTNSAGMLLVLFISSIVTATGEEIGWRGFLLPKMSEIWNVKTAVIISGLIWAVWHFPLMIAGLYNPGTPLWYQLSIFTIEVIAITAIMAIIRLNSKSVWPAIILHASHNYFDQVIFSPLTIGEKSTYFVGETGAITAIALVLVALFMMRKNNLRNKNSTITQ